MSLKHRKVVNVADDPAAAGKLRPSDWGSPSTDYDTAPTHVFDGGTLGALAMYDTGAVDKLSWLPSEAGVLVSDGDDEIPVFRPLLAADIPALAYEPTIGTLGVAKGGTGLAAFTVGDLPYASGVTTLSKLASVAAGSVLVSSGVGAAPAWSATPTLTSLTTTNLGAGASGILHLVPTVALADPTRKIMSVYWDPVAAAASPQLSWTETLTFGAPNFSTQDNKIFQMGHNVAPGGGLLDVAYSGTRDAWEEYYEPVSTGVGYSERHISIVPLDVATKGEIRLLSFMGRANVNRDLVEPHASFLAEFVTFKHPSFAAVALGDALRISLAGAPNYGAQINLNNKYSSIYRSGAPDGNTAIIQQQNAALNGTIAAMYWDTNTNRMRLNVNSAGGVAEVHIAEVGHIGRFFVDGTNSANSHALFSLKDGGGAGNIQSFIGQDAATLYIGAPQTLLANYNDATLAASCQLAIVNTGRVGVGAAVPTAWLHLKAGAAAPNSAPLKFTSGTHLTTAEAGAMEYNGTNLFFTRAGATREGVLTQSAVTTESVVSDTTVTVNINGVTYKLLARA